MVFFAEKCECCGALNKSYSRCSVCGKKLTGYELDESTYISKTAGYYSSHMEDGESVEMMICQDCFNDILYKYCTER